MQIFIVISLFIAIVAVVFAVQNSEPATISFLAWDGRLPLALVLMFTLLAGVLVGIFVSLPSNLRHRFRIRNQNKTINDLNTALEEQRSKREQAEARLKEIEAKPDEPAPGPEEGVDGTVQPEILPVSIQQAEAEAETEGKEKPEEPAV